MRAHVGDWLFQGSDHGRSGQITGMRNADGSPLYVVRWQAGGHIAPVFPGLCARIAAEAPKSGQLAAGAPQ
jgi:Domain of unknown function (DUF1918)